MFRASPFAAEVEKNAERMREEFRVIVEDEVRADYRAAYTFLHTCRLLSRCPSLSPRNYKTTVCAADEGEVGGAGAGESKVKLRRQTTRRGVLRVLLIARRKV